MLINATYRRMWFGQTVSQLGDMVFTTGLMLWVATGLFKESGFAPLASSALLALVALIVIVVSPIAGVLVDRWPNKRRTMLVSDVVRATAVGALTAVTLLPGDLLPDVVEFGLAVATVVVVTSAAQFFNPARFVVLADVVDERKRGVAASYGQASSAIATIIGPAIAGPLVVWLGETGTFAVNAASFIISYVAIRGVPAPVSASADPRKGLFGALRDGLGFVLSNRRLRAVMLTGVLVMVGAGALSALDVYFVLENLGASGQWFGYISAAMGVGLLVGAMAAGGIGDRVGHRRVFHASMIMAGLTLVVYSRLTMPVAAVIVIALYGVCAGALETVVGPLTMEAAPREFLGRVISVYTPAFRLASMVSIAGAGAVTGLFPEGARLTVLSIEFGRVDLTFLFTAIMLLVGGAYAIVAMRGGRPVTELVEETVTSDA